MNSQDPHILYKNKHGKRLYDDYTLEEKVDEALNILESLMYAFPEGPSKHRETHEAWMAAKEAEARFWTELKLDLAKKGLWALLLVLLGLMVSGLMIKLGAKI